MPSHYGAKQNFASTQQGNIPMGPLWTPDPNAGQPRQGKDFWGSGPGNMPEHISGFGAETPYNRMMNPEWLARAGRTVSGNPESNIVNRIQGTAGNPGTGIDLQQMWQPKNRQFPNNGFDPLSGKEQNALNGQSMFGKLGDFAGNNFGAIVDALGTGYDIWQNESFRKPMMKEEHARAGVLHDENIKALKYNLAGAQRDEGRNVQNQVRLWNNLSRKEGEEERTVENWTPTTYA